MKTLFVVATLLSSQFAFSSINSRDYIDCLEKAMNEEIQVTISEAPHLMRECDYANQAQEDCDKLTENHMRRLFDKYAEIGTNGRVIYYSAESMGEYSVRWHYERIWWDLDILERKWNLPGIKHTNIKIVERALARMLGVDDMWRGSDNGSAKFAEYDFSYCSED